MTREEAEKHIKALYGIPTPDSGTTTDDLCLDMISEMGFAALTDAAVIALAGSQLRLHEFNKK